MLFATPRLESRDHEVIEQVLDLRRDLRYHLAVRRRWTGLLRRVTLASAIRSSNSIEGYRVSAEDALAAVDLGEPVQTAENDAAWDATLGYRRAMTYVLQLHDDPNFSYNVGLLKGLHFMMVEHDLQSMPGRWRPGPVFVSDTVSGDIVYEGPDSDLVPTLMDELVTRLTEGESPTLVRAAMAHLNLVMVHPHKDGNGRMARVLQSLVLAREGILAPEFCSIEEYLGRFTQEYYRMLADVGSGRWRPDRDATPWVRFCLTAHFRQARVLLARTREIGRLFEMIDEHLDAHDLPARAAAPLYLAVLGHRLTNVTYRAQADTTPNTASRDLRALVVAGLLAAHGEKRGRTYTATRRLAASWRDATVAVRQQDRLDPYLTDDATVDPYARPRLS